MSRKITLTIDMWVDGGREVREVTLDENLRNEAKHLVRRLRKDHNYNVVRVFTSWDSIRDDGRGAIGGPRKRAVFKSLIGTLTR